MSCQGCPKRVVGCHSTCPDYQEFRRKLDEQREARLKSQMLTSKSPAQVKRMDRYKKRYGK